LNQLKPTTLTAHNIYTILITTRWLVNWWS